MSHGPNYKKKCLPKFFGPVVHEKLAKMFVRSVERSFVSVCRAPVCNASSVSLFQKKKKKKRRKKREKNL